MSSNSGILLVHFFFFVKNIYSSRRCIKYRKKYLKLSMYWVVFQKLLNR